MRYGSACLMTCTIHGTWKASWVQAQHSLDSVGLMAFSAEALPTCITSSTFIGLPGHTQACVIPAAGAYLTFSVCPGWKDLELPVNAPLTGTSVSPAEVTKVKEQPLNEEASCTVTLTSLPDPMGFEGVAQAIARQERVNNRRKEIKRPQIEKKKAKT